VVVESRRLDRMLANLLSLAAIMAGRLQPATEPVLLGVLAERVAAEVGKQAPDFTVRVEIARALPPAEADPALLEQVLRNLYENAIKYSPGGGVIRTTGGSDGASVTVSVTDQGSGIAPEHVPHVFERFRRPGADPTVRGMGLGLYLSRLLVEAQRGTIVASSAGVGKGATFSVTLPIAEGWTGDDGATD
jgi:signal transduction histidine kinase